MELMTEEKKGFKKTIVGLIPDDWEVSNLGQIAEVKTGPFGSSLHKEDYVEVGTPIITVEHLGVSQITTQNLPKVSDSDYKRLSNYKLRAGDIVFSRVGSIDRNAYVTDDENGWLFSGRLLRIRVTNEDVSSKYLSYHFSQTTFKERIKSVAVGQTMPSLNTKILDGINVVIPPTLAEQQAIASALSDMDELIRSLDALIQKKEALKKGTMQQLLSGKKRLPGFDGKWEVKVLGELIEKIIGGGTPSRSKKEYWNGDIPWATVKDFRTFHKNGTQEQITKAGLQNSSSNLIPKGTVITSTRMGLGQAVIYDVDVAINQDLKAILTNKRLDPEYLFYWFSANKKEIESLGSGSTVKGISLGDLKNFETYVSDSVKEQKAIAQILSDMDEELQTLRSKRKKVGKIKQGMMQELLTGRVRLV